MYDIHLLKYTCTLCSNEEQVFSDTYQALDHQLLGIVSESTASRIINPFEIWSVFAKLTITFQIHTVTSARLEYLPHDHKDKQKNANSK